MKYIDACLSMQTQENMYMSMPAIPEMVLSSILAHLAHLAHLAQSFFLI